jgi:hypothetical protein
MQNVLYGRPRFKVINGRSVLLLDDPVPVVIEIPKNASVYSILGRESGIGILTEKGEMKILGMSREEAEKLYRLITAGEVHGGRVNRFEEA